MGPADLAQVLQPLTAQLSPSAITELLVGLQASDDAAVYRLNPQQAIILTTDFFPPVVDDPYSFGAIAAANAMSDVYAMGGEVLLALNLAAFPDDLDRSILTEILRGGADKVAEAGGIVAGGHTVTDREPKYGLVVTGIVHPERILTKGGARPGDVLVLTKPLGTGVVTTALKQDRVEAIDLAATVESMMRLNRTAMHAAQAVNAHAATDITGFGLAGHALEMTERGGVCFRFSGHALPWLPGAVGYAERHIFAGGLWRNRDFFAPRVRIDTALSDAVGALLYDPQTSGGLLVALDANRFEDFRRGMGLEPFWTVGTVEVGEGLVVG